MPILLVIAWAALFVIRYGQRAGAVRAAMDASVAFGALTVLGVEALSLPSWYTPAGVGCYWLAVCALVIGLGRFPLREGLRGLRALRPARPSLTGAALGAAVAAFILGALLSALLYPPMNYDSMVYHMPRVFFWMKNASVHNYPSAVGRQLFASPLNAYYILQAQVMCLGGDLLANLVQWFAYVGSVAAAVGIASLLGAGRGMRWLTALLTAATPLAVLQAGSTQSDLLTAFWCLAVVYYAACYWKGLGVPGAAGRPLLLWAACVGGAVGLALLSKLNALAVLAPFALLVAALMCKRRAWGELKASIAPVLACALLINAGFFVRNAVDLDGDFLAYNLPESDLLHVRTGDPAERAALMTQNLAYNLTNTPIPAVNWVMDGVVQRICRWLGVPVDLEAISKEPWSTKRYVGVELHDVRVSPLQTALGYAAIAALLAAALGRKKRRGFPAALALATLAAFAATAFSIRFVSSIPRYMLPPLLISVALLPSALALGGGRWRGARRVLAGALAVLAVYLGTGPLLFNMFQPLVWQPSLARLAGVESVGLGWYEASRQRLRAYAMGSRERDLDALVARIEALDIRRIGIGEYPLASYPLLYPFRDARYDVRYVDAAYLSGYEDPSFEPQAILAMYAPGEAPARLDRGGTFFKLDLTCPATIMDACLYLPESSID